MSEGNVECIRRMLVDPRTAASSSFHRGTDQPSPLRMLSGPVRRDARLILLPARDEGEILTYISSSSFFVVFQLRFVTLW